MDIQLVPTLLGAAVIGGITAVVVIVVGAIVDMIKIAHHEKHGTQQPTTDPSKPIHPMSNPASGEPVTMPDGIGPAPEKARRK